VHLTPTHLAAYLHADLAHLAEPERPWIYGNPFRVE
jgi:hypothetical protein